ncbi:Rap1-interacting factor 1 N terminal-domain-containing protein [Massariosphaeria phaeospora]|uniref:Rap1-interacting factor 1 N terminal-domain-containing protein n=1 Tax=Massariosphaeria phaeospora TaxID=100035 RepID=A0A7C8MJ01_9PLEO|nr:Rap1-interacting factor 1 N terminal-domain-containing protein [Massariosphaeria phaeospora]
MEFPASTSKFESLPTRPPTPPKEVEDTEKDINDTLQFLDDPFGIKPVVGMVAAPPPSLNTPSQSPSSEAPTPSSSATRMKRVNFQFSTCAIPTNGSSPQPWTPANSSPLRPLPQTRVLKPLKSILKAGSPCDEGVSAHQFKTLAEMLEFSVKRLAADKSRGTKLDTYMSLQKTMKAYEGVPGLEALSQKTGLLTQFIRRDLQAMSPTGPGLDSQLIQQALKLLMAMVRIPEARSAMDHDFCSYVIDRSIQVASDGNMSKSIVNYHLAVLMQQNFPPMVITDTRVEKILDVLDTLPDRVSGLSVLAYRLRIYRKLLQQKPKLMAKHTERWFRHTVNALLSKQKDINQSALDTALTAAKIVGTEPQVTRSVLSVLNGITPDGDTFGSYMATELEGMLTSDAASAVPQVWASITMLLRDSMQVSTFLALRDWLKLFETLHSSDNEAVKVHTSVAYSSLVYAVNISHYTAPSWSKVFLQLPKHQLQARNKLRKTSRNAVNSGYTSLLYYALRPTASHEQLDRYWREFVAEFWKPFVHSSPVHAVVACRVVSALFNGSRRPWNEQRALDLKPQSMVPREDLPLLDPKWVRKALVSVLQFVETLVDATPWNKDMGDDQPVKIMWLSLLDSLVEASNKEVMASSETKDAIAHIVNSLRHVWERHTASLAMTQQKENVWADKFCFLLNSVVQKLGAIQFTGKCLTRNEKDEFEVAPTPSHRSRHHGPRVSPLLYFIDLLVNQSEGKLSDPVRLRALNLIIEPCLDVQNTRLSKLELLKDCCTPIAGSPKASVKLILWAQIGTLTKSCLQEPTSDSNERISRQLGKEYDVVVDILALGSSYLSSRPQGQDVLSTFVKTVRIEAGEGAVILAVIEKVSEFLLKRVPEEDHPVYQPYASILLRSLPSTIITRRALEQVRQTLWPSSTTERIPNFDPYHHFYATLMSIGTAAYRELHIDVVDSTRDFISALSNSIQNCHVSLLAVYLRKTQEMIRLWVEDDARKLHHKEEPIKDLQREVVSLWRIINAAIESLPRKDSQTLLHLEPLMTAGFLSRRHSIVNISITAWNSTFGKEDSLRYPAQLEQALRRLRNTAEICLPSLEAQDENMDDRLSFYDSGDSAMGSAPAVNSPRVKESPFKVLKSTRKSQSPALSSRKTSRSTAKLRLRHDNSQIQFEPIVSSPTNPFNQESQILTDRQKEMIERQRGTANIFSSIRSTSSPGGTGTAIPSTSLEIHSDPMNADELPTANSLTPSKALASLGSMDFLGSSPTPQARNRIPDIVSDVTSVVTPTAVRTFRLDDNADDLGSSPPHFEKVTNSKTKDPASDITNDNVAGDSFEYRQPERSYSMSFDDGTTIDEDAPELDDASPFEAPNVPDSGEAVLNMPSSNLEQQLTAQFDADIRDTTGAEPAKEVPNESNNMYIDARSQQQAIPMTNIAHAAGDAEVDDTQIALAMAVTQDEDGQNSSDISRVGDSFINLSTDRLSTGKAEDSARRTPRSSRSSVLSSPAKSESSRKRKQTPVDQESKSKKVKNEEVQRRSSSLLLIDHDDGIQDCIDVALPPARKTRKSKGSSQSPSKSQVVVPETSRKRPIGRSTSLLSHVQTHSETVLVEDTPSPKRTRRTTHQDVSTAKNSPQRETQGSQVKRLSHVQVTPKRSSERFSSVRGSSVATQSAASAKDVQDEVSTAGQNADVVLQVDGDTRASRETGQSQSRHASVTSTPSRSFAERVILTPKSILGQLKNILANCSQLVLGRTEEREFDDVLFDIRREVHAAGRRGEDDE